MSASEKRRDNASLGQSAGNRRVPEPSMGWSVEELAVVWDFYRRRRWVVLCSLLLSLAFSGLVVCIRGAEYRVSALLYYKLGAELAPPSTLNREQVMITRRKEDVNNELEILTSPHLLQDVVQELGEDFFQDAPPVGVWGHAKYYLRKGRQRASDTVQEVLIGVGLRQRLTKLQKIEVALRDRLQAETLRETDVVSITLRTPAPDAGVVILSKLLDGYVKQHLAAHQETGVKAFFANQSQDFRQRLEDSEQELLAYQTSHSVWSEDEQRRELLESRRAVELAFGASQARISSLTMEVASLATRIDETPATIEVSSTEQMNPAIEDLEDRLASLMLDQAVVSTAYVEQAREVLDRQQQISRLQAQRRSAPALVAQARTMGVNPSRPELVKTHALKQAELAGLQSRSVTERQQLAELDVRLRDLEIATSELRRLQREHDLLEQNYKLYAENLEKSRITVVMNDAAISNLKVISPPTSTMVPSSPRLKLVLAAAAFVGLVLGTAWGVVQDVRAAARATSA